MSLILDALNKSESERQKQTHVKTDDGASKSGAGQQEEPHSTEPKKRLTIVIWLVAVVGLGAVVGITSTYYFLNNKPEMAEPVSTGVQEITRVTPDPKLVITNKVQTSPVTQKQAPTIHTLPEVQNTAQENPTVLVAPKIKAPLDSPEENQLIKAAPVIMEGLKSEANLPVPVHSSDQAIHASVDPATGIQDKEIEAFPSKPMEVIRKEKSAEKKTHRRFQMPPVKPVSLQRRINTTPERTLLPGGSSPEAMFERGNAFADQGLYSRAVEEYSKAVSARPGYLEAYFGRAWTHVEGKEYNSAIADFDQVIVLNPMVSDAWYGRGWANEQAKQNSAAIRDYEKAVELSPTHSEADFSRGYLYFQSNRYQDAAEAFTSTLSNSTGEMREYSLLWLYLSLARTGQDAQSILAPQLQKAPLTVWPGRLVSFYLQGGDRDSVIQQIESGDLATRRERQCVGYFFLGQLALVSGDTAEAIGYFRIALATGATNYRQYAASAHELKSLGQ